MRTLEFSAPRNWLASTRLPLVTCASLSLGLACSQGSSERVAPGASPVASESPAATAAQAIASPPLLDPAQLVGTPVDVHGALRVEGTRIVDASGAPVQLRGPSSMWLNWEQTGYAKNLDLGTLLRDTWGATLIRAAMGVEPAGAYLSSPATAERAVRAVIDNALRLGLYVIIDWHDHEAVAHVEESVAFFRKMAEIYGDYPNVIYEVFNEPLQVDWSADLKPYHERLVAEIRAIDPDNLIILGTPNWSQYVDEAGADPVQGENLAYTLHFYSCSHDAWLRDRADSAIADGIALFVTEWGATHADGGTPDNPGLCLDEGEIWHQWMNDNAVSWAAWKLDDCVDESCYFVPGAPADGSFTPDQLTGHGAFIRDKMVAPWTPPAAPPAAAEPAAP